jgi:transcriptional antiterminator RfaH
MEKHGWLALYTKPRNEKKLHDSITEQGIESYLPLHETIRIWSDRRKKVQVPLFPSYVFVRPKTRQEYYIALNCFGAVRFITFCGKPAVVTDKEIEAIRLLLNEECEYEMEASNETFSPGEWIEIFKGALRGFQGEMIEHRGQYKLIVRIGALEQSLLVTVPLSDVKKLETTKRVG